LLSTKLVELKTIQVYYINVKGIFIALSSELMQFAKGGEGVFPVKDMGILDPLANPAAALGECVRFSG